MPLLLHLWGCAGPPRARVEKYPTSPNVTAACACQPLPFVPSFSFDACQPLTRKLAELEAEARAMGATVPPPPNPAVLATLMGRGGRGGGAEAGGGRGSGR